MKSYNQFVSESYSARENIQEALPLIPIAIGAGKALSYGLAAYSAYQAAQKLKKGDYKGAAVDAALAIPSARIAGGMGRALQLGTKGTQVLKHGTRLAKTGVYGDELRRELSTPESSTQSASTQSASSKNATATGKTSPSQPVSSGNTSPTSSTSPTSPTQPAPRPSSTVLARRKGVQGKLDKSTGKWTQGDWSTKESDRYKRVSAALKSNK